MHIPAHRFWVRAGQFPQLPVCAFARGDAESVVQPLCFHAKRLAETRQLCCEVSKFLNQDLSNITDAE